MSTSNGHRHRLRRIEDGRPSETSNAEKEAEASAYREEHNRWAVRWNEAAAALIASMAPVHVELLVQDIGWYEDPDPSSSWGRVRLEVRACLEDKVGLPPLFFPRCPDSPLALHPAVVEAILADAPGLQTRCVKCMECSYWMPAAGAQVAIECSGDLTWRYRDTGESCAAPSVPACTLDRARWRPITLFSVCPLCGCEELSGTAEFAPARPDNYERYVKRQARLQGEAGRVG